MHFIQRLFLCVLLCVGLAEAHPHIFVDASVELLFDASGFIGVRNHWVFDEMYSTALLASVDSTRSGNLGSKAEAHLRGSIAASLRGFHYFNNMAQGDGLVYTPEATNMVFRMDKGRLVCDLTMPYRYTAGSDYTMLLFVLVDPVNYTQLNSDLTKTRVKAPAGVEVEYFVDSVSDMILFKGVPTRTQGLFFRFRRLP